MDALVCDHIKTRPNVDHPTQLDVLTASTQQDEIDRSAPEHLVGD